jgi:ABC-type sugar transport system permease subunit
MGLNNTKKVHRLRISRAVVLLACAPAAILLTATFALPIVETLRLSFSRWGGVGAVKYVGTENYRNLLQNQDFYHSVWITFVFASLTTIGVVLLSTSMAIAANRRTRFGETYRALWFLPAIAPPAAVAVFWAISVQPQTGIINGILGKIGLGNTHEWLADPNTALYVIIAATIWISVAFPFLLLIGAIDRIPWEVFEAARIDGASENQQTRYFTVPLIQPVLVMILVLEFVWNFNGFTLVWAMTKGGPAGSTAILPILLYQEAFQNGSFGSASAVGVVSGVFLILIGAFGLRFANSRTAI